MGTLLRHSAILSLIGLLTVLRIPYGWGALTHENFVSLHQRPIVVGGEKKIGYQFANDPSFLSALDSDTENDSLSLPPIVIVDGTNRLTGLTKFRVFVPPGAWRINLTLFFAIAPHAYVVKLGDVPDEAILAQFESQGGISRFNFDTQNLYTLAELHEPKFLTNGGSGFIQVLNKVTTSPVSDDEGGWLYVWMLYPANAETAYLKDLQYYVAVRPNPYIDWYNRMTTKGGWDSSGDPKENWAEILKQSGPSVTESVTMNVQTGLIPVLSGNVNGDAQPVANIVVDLNEAKPLGPGQLKFQLSQGAWANPDDIKVSLNGEELPGLLEPSSDDPSTLLLSVPQLSLTDPLNVEISNLKMTLANATSKQVSVTVAYENQGAESGSPVQLALREDPLTVGYVAPVLVPLNGTKDLELGGVAPLATSSAPGVLSVTESQIVTKVQLKGIKQGKADLTITDQNGEEATIQCQVQAFATQEVGGEPGNLERTFSVDDPYKLSLLLSTTPRADHQGLVKQEWVFLYAELSDQQQANNLFLFLTPNGAVPYSDDLDFATAAFNQALDDPFDILGYFHMEDILPSELGFINTLTFGYAYSLQEFHSYGDLFSGLWAQQFFLGNTVTIKINGN